MRSLVLAASLLAAAVATGARAADLDEGPPPDRYGSAYDDPRYADIYKYPRPPGYAVPPPGPMPRPPPYAGPVPRERVYREDEATSATIRARGATPMPSRCRPMPGAACRARWSRTGSSAQGWRDFHDGDVRGEIATVRARRPSGRLFG